MENRAENLLNKMQLKIGKKDFAFKLSQKGIHPKRKKFTRPLVSNKRFRLLMHSNQMRCKIITRKVSILVAS